MQRTPLLTPQAVPMLDDRRIAFALPDWCHVAVVVNASVTALAAAYIVLGIPVALPLAVSATVATLAWLRTTYRRPVSRTVLPLYIATVVGLHVQALEQYARDYPTMLSRVFHEHLAPPVHLTMDTWVVAGPVALTALFLLGAVLAFYHHPVGNFLAWLLAIHAVVAGAWVFVPPFVAGKVAYVPGMATAIVPFVLGVVLARTIVRRRLAERPR